MGLSFLATVGVDRVFLAVGDGVNSARGHAAAYEVLLNRVRAPRAEGEVVLPGPQFIAIAFDPHANSW